MITVCITCYDKDFHLLDDLLKLFKEQVNGNDEIIVVGSGFSKDIDVPNYIFPKRVNQATARNHGFKLASNDIIMFFDVDDIPHPQKLEITKDIFTKGAEALIHDYNINNNVFDELHDNGLFIEYAQKDVNSTNLKHPSGIKLHHAHITVIKDIKVRFNESNEYYRREDGKFCQDLIDNNINVSVSKHRLVNYTT